jgi:DDE superfamily endonuclease/Helix-turn-helix of DDE superfamily endonuclease
MGLTYARIKDTPKKLLALTGLTRTEFDDLLAAFTIASQPDPAVTQQGHRRQRKAGGGRKATLPLTEDRLWFILVYLKTDPLQEIMAELFDLDVSNVNEWMHRLLPLVRDALDELGVLPERDAQAVAPAQAQRPTGQTVILDGTERRRQRPPNPEKQVLHYSGKKKAHTDKNLVITERKTTRVTYLSQTYPGIAHDKKIADHEQIHYLPKTTRYQYTGFQGYQPADVRVRQPKKSRAGAN